VRGILQPCVRVDPASCAKVRVYPGADAEFALYRDDGMTHAYEHGDSRITQLHWNDATHRLDHQGASAWTAPDSEVVDVVNRDVVK
jgi:alpha-D-xyloside xylohydrolase